jgi:GT2 family glycosyltransferase
MAETALMEPRVSVIVPVRDDVDRLEHLVDCLRQQTLPRDAFEVVIGDDGSNEPVTARVEAEAGWLRIIRCPPKTGFAARNVAVGSSRGEVLAFTDSDCRPEPDWLERGLEAMRYADMVGGRVRFLVDGVVGVWGLIDMETFLDQERYVQRGRAVTANLFVTRSLFDRVNGFEETLRSGGDMVFTHGCIRAGGRLAYADDAVVSHPVRDGAASVLGKVWSVQRAYAYRQGRAGTRRPPLAATWRTLLPSLGVFRSRLAARTLALDHALLTSRGAQPSLGQHLRALPLIYLLIPYLGAAAQTIGWWQGRQQSGVDRAEERRRLPDRRGVDRRQAARHPPAGSERRSGRDRRSGPRRAREIPAR